MPNRSRRQTSCHPESVARQPLCYIAEPGPAETAAPGSPAVARGPRVEAGESLMSNLPTHRSRTTRPAARSSRYKTTRLAAELKIQEMSKTQTKTVPLALYYGAIFAALGVYLPFFPRWLEARGIEGLRMGIVTAAVPAMGLLGPPAFGLIADLLQLRGLLIRVAAFGAFLGFGVVAAYGLAGWNLSYGGLLAAVLLASLFRSVLIPMGDVLALEHARRTGTSYGRLRLWGSAGFLGAVLATGRWIDPTHAAALPLAIASGLFAAFGLTVLLPDRAPPAPAADRDSVLALLRNGAFRLFLATYFLAQLAHSNYDLSFSLHLRDLGASSDFVGRAWALGVLAEIVLMAFAHRISGRYEARHLVVFAIAGAAGRWALIGGIRSLPILMALQPLHALAFGLLWIASLSIVRQQSTPQTLATAQGLFAAAAAAGSVLGLLLWSDLYRRHGGGFTFPCASLVSSAAMGVALVGSRRWRTCEGPERTIS